MSRIRYVSTFFFFFNDTATTEIYTLSLHDALPISFGTQISPKNEQIDAAHANYFLVYGKGVYPRTKRSEEHTSELQSPCNLVCRLLLDKKQMSLYAEGGEDAVHSHIVLF